METESLDQRFERIRADLDRIQRTERWPVAEVYEREGDHHFSVRIISPDPSPPKKDSA